MINKKKVSIFTVHRNIELDVHILEVVVYTN